MQILSGSFCFRFLPDFHLASLPLFASNCMSEKDVILDDLSARLITYLNLNKAGVTIDLLFLLPSFPAFVAKQA